MSLSLNSYFRIMLIVISIKPLLDLFWQIEIGPLKLIWIPYFIMLPMFAIYLAWCISVGRLRFEPAAALVLVVLAIFQYYLAGSVSVDSYFRLNLSIFISLVLIHFAGNVNALDLKLTKKIFFFGVFLSLTIGILQYVGLFPNYEFDWVDGVRVPRATGGYSKPTNFGAYIYPLFMFCLGMSSVSMQRTKKIKWVFFASIILSFVLVVIKYRTWSIIFLVSYLLYFVPYKLFFVSVRSVFFGVLTAMSVFYLFLVFYADFFKQQGWLLRGRVANWSVHLSEFFESEFVQILFGRGKVFTNFYGQTEGGFAIEFHSDFGRVLITYGILGFLLIYYLVYNWVLLAAGALGRRLKWCGYAIFLSYCFYSITNETLHYPSILFCFVFSFLVLFEIERNERIR